MRFTFLLPSDNLTGGTRVVAVYARELLALGHEVLVVTCAQDRPPLRRRLRDWLHGPGASGAAGAPVPGHIALASVPHKRMARPGPIRAADVPDADVIVATWWETAVWMHAMPARKGRKVHLIQGYETWLGSQYVPQVHAALRLPNLKVAISEALRATIVDAVGELGLTVIPNAVDPAQFHAPPRERGTIPTVGFAYAQAAIKGADICARACALARERLPELRILAFGSEPPTPEMPLPAGTEYHLRPAQDALRLHYAACDAWLFGSRLDSFGLPILEAMACRTPVIAVPIGAAPQLLEGGGGTLVPPEDPRAMAHAIVRLFEQPASQWRRQSDSAHATAHGHTWRDAAQQLLTAIGQPGA